MGFNRIPINVRAPIAGMILLGISRFYCYSPVFSEKLIGFTIAK